MRQGVQKVDSQISSLVVCTSCEASKEAQKFSPDKRRKNGRQARCKTCCADARRAEYRANPELFRERKRDEVRKQPERTRARDRLRWPDRAEVNRLRRYGITPDEYRSLLALQHYVCAICEQACITGKRLAVDHCHTSGNNRGLLCGRCNTGLGQFEDNPDRLERAVIYLLTHGGKLLSFS